MCRIAYAEEITAEVLTPEESELTQRLSYKILYNTASKSGRLICGLASRDIE